MGGRAAKRTKLIGPRRMSRRDFLRLGGAGLAGSALLGTGALVGCGDGSRGGALTVASWDVASDALKATIPLFKKKRPGTDVQMQAITIDYQQLIPRLQAGSGAPDVFSLAQQDFQNFLMRFPGEFVDVTDRMEGYTSQFAEAPLSHARKDGKLFAVPWDMGPVGLWYRKDLFEKAGIAPDDVATYDGFIEAGKELERKVGGGAKMTAFDASGGGTNPSHYHILLNQQDGSFYGSGGKIDFTNEKSYRAMGVLDRFVTEEIAVDTPTYDEISRAISNGDAATDMGAAWDVGLIKSAGGKAQKGKWDVMPLPAFASGGPREATLSGSVLVISSQSQNVDAAWDFIEQALLTKEGQSESWAQGLFPSWEPYWETAAFNEPDPFFGFAVAPKFADIARKVPALDYGPHFLDFQKPLMDAYAAVLTGDTAPQEAFAQAEERAASASGLRVA
jgi:lactose/L-arabinose transport system substrate-binding protein